MKRWFLLLLIACTACKSYRVTSLGMEIPFDSITNMDKPCNKISSLNDLPRRIRNMPEFKYQYITNDSAYFNANKGKVSLFICGAYDPKTKSGFFIQGFNGNECWNQCTLFQIQDTVIQCNWYGLSTSIHTWNDAKPYLIWPKDQLFSGGTAIFKPNYYKKKK